MSRPLVFRRAAFNDLTQAITWYDRQRPGLGEEFHAAIRDTCNRIADRPGSFPIAHRDIRRANLGRFPYGIFFRALDDRIVVTAIMHGARDPGRWQRRR